jgi:hypothetical protein
MAVGSPCLKTATYTGPIVYFLGAREHVCFCDETWGWSKASFRLTSLEINKKGSYGICGLMGEILNYKLIFIMYDNE